MFGFLYVSLSPHQYLCCHLSLHVVFPSILLSLLCILSLPVCVYTSPPCLWYSILHLPLPPPLLSVCLSLSPRISFTPNSSLSPYYLPLLYLYVFLLCACLYSSPSPSPLLLAYYFFQPRGVGLWRLNFPFVFPSGQTTDPTNPLSYPPPPLSLR